MQPCKEVMIANCIISSKLQKSFKFSFIKRILSQNSIVLNGFKNIGL